MSIQFRLPFDTNRHAGFTTPLRLILATTASLWMGAAQAQAFAPVAPRAAMELRFRDFFQTPSGSAELEISDTLKKANGQNVRLVGYMVQEDAPTPGRFRLASRPLKMHTNAAERLETTLPSMVVIYLDSTQENAAVPHVHGLVTVHGTLSVSHQNGHERGQVFLTLKLPTAEI